MLFSTFQDLCHSHCDDATVQKKITAIIDRFINSAIPPAVQIDISAELAQKILEHRKELGPYIFREAQVRSWGISVTGLIEPVCFIVRTVSTACGKSCTWCISLATKE